MKLTLFCVKKSDLNIAMKLKSEKGKSTFFLLRLKKIKNQP